MAKRGGKRDGAGRPVSPSTIETQKQREMLIKLLEPRLKDIFTALAEKAKQGDVQAARELFDRAWGKAPQAIDLSNKDGTLKTVIVQKYAGDSNNKPAT